MDGLYPGMMICKSCTAIMQVCKVFFMLSGDIRQIIHQLSLSITGASFAENATTPKCTHAFVMYKSASCPAT